MYFERNQADYYGFVAKHTRIDHDNYSRGCRHGRAHARTQQKIRRRKRADARFTVRSYTVPVPYAKYRSESIKQRYRIRKETRRANVRFANKTLYAFSVPIRRYGTIRIIYTKTYRVPDITLYGPLRFTAV